MKTKRQVGILLEEKVVDRLKEIEPNCRRTKGSGSATELGDILSKYILCECKQRDTKDVTIREEIWNKLLLELPISSKRVPIYVLGNKNNKQWVCLDMNDFFDIFIKMIKSEENK